MSKSPRRQRLIVEALESRLLFSATADIALFDDGNSDADQLQQSAQQVDLVDIYSLGDDTLIPPDASNADEDTSTNLVAEDTSAPAAETKMVVFVDTSVEDYQQLVDDIRANHDESTLDIIFLDPSKNAIEQITEQLNLYTGLTAIHIISHGKNGSVDFSNASLNQHTLHLYEDDLAAWSASLSDDADILFYGCDLAATEVGQQLLAQIASLTQADIAASTNATGHTSLQADWNLEFQLGAIETTDIISEAAEATWVHVLADVSYIRILNGNLSQTFTSGSNIGQNFTVNSGDIQNDPTYVVNQINVKLKKDADAAAQTITVELRDSWSGTLLRSDTISSAGLTTDFQWVNFDFSNITLNANQGYVVRISTTGTDGKVMASYNGSSVWNNTDMVINGVTDNSKDLTFYLTNEDGLNATPTINAAIPNQSATEDTAFNFQFASNTFADADPLQSLTYTAQLAGGGALPAWLSFDANTRTFSGTPTNGDVGTVSIDVTANDGNGGTITDTFNITVANINDAPSGTNATLTVLEDGAHTFTAANFGFSDTSDSPANTLSAVTITTLPGNGALTLNGNAVTAGDSISVADINSGLLVFTPAANANGAAYTSFTFQVQDNGGTANGGVDLDPTPNTITFDVTSVNDAPSGTNATLTVLEDGAHTFTTANFGFSDTSDSPANTLSAVTITTLPSNGALTLNGNAVTAGDSISVADINSGLLVFTPAANANGAAYTSLTFQVQDNGGTANGGVDLDQSANTITFDVTSVNDAPSGTNATLTVLEDGAHTFTAANFGFSDTSDSPANTLSAVTITTLPSNGALTLNGNAVTAGDSISVADINSGLLVFTPAANANGAAYTSLTFQVQDNGGTANGGVNLDQSANTITFDVTSVNDAPSGTNATLTVLEDGAHTFTTANFGFSDTGDSPANTLSAVTITTLPGNGALTLNGNAVTAGDSISVADINSGLLVFTPAANANGAAYTSFTFQVQDNGGTANGGVNLDQSANTITFDVTGINDTPTLANAIPNQTATEDVAFNFQFASNTFADIDVGNTLTYTATLSGGGALPAWLSFDANTRTFSGTPLNANVGTISVEVTANDGNGGTVADTFDIVVANANDAPTVANAIPNQAATEDVAFNFQFASNTFADVDVGNTLTYTATLSGGGALPAWLSFDANTRTFSGTPLNANVGTISVEVTANDGNGGTVADTFDIVVANANDAPTVANAIPNQIATEDTPFIFQFAANTFADTDAGDTLTYTAQLTGGGALPAWLSFDANTRTFSGTPLNANVGAIAIDVIANDGMGGTITDTFSISVLNANDAPTLVNAIPNQSATEDVTFNFQFAANTFADADLGDTLTYTAQLTGGGALPAWLSFDANTRTFSGTPTNDDVGTIAIEVIANDGNGGSATGTFTINTINVNDAPTLANAVNNQTVTEDEAFSIQIPLNTFDDVDLGDTLAYTAQLAGGGALPSWLSFDASTRTLSGIASNDDVGTITIILTATDSSGTSISDSFDVTVVNSNDAPTVTAPISNHSVVEESTFTLQFQPSVFTDIDIGDTLTFSAQLVGGGALPAWLSFDPNTLTFSGTPTTSDAGTLAIEVIANDGNGGSATETFELTVNKRSVPPIDPVTPTPPDVPKEDLGDGTKPPIPGIDTPVDEEEVENPINPPTPDNPTLVDDSRSPNSLIDVEDIAQADKNNRARMLQLEQDNARSKDLLGLSTSPLLASLITPDSGFTPDELQSFDDALRKMRKEMDETIADEAQQKAIITGVTISITTGLLIWSLRASSLLLTLFSMLPLWRGIDPLPILDEVNKRKKELEQQRKDKQTEDKNAKEVGYLFDNTNAQPPRKNPK